MRGLGLGTRHFASLVVVDLRQGKEALVRESGFGPTAVFRITMLLNRTSRYNQYLQKLSSWPSKQF